MMDEEAGYELYELHRRWLNDNISRRRDTDGMIDDGVFEGLRKEVEIDRKSQRYRADLFSSFRETMMGSGGCSFYLT